MNKLHLVYARSRPFDQNGTFVTTGEWYGPYTLQEADELYGDEIAFPMGYDTINQEEYENIT